MMYGERRLNMADGGKGSKQRPTDPKKYDEGYERIFGKNRKKKEDNKK